LANNAQADTLEEKFSAVASFKMIGTKRLARSASESELEIAIKVFTAWSLITVSSRLARVSSKFKIEAGLFWTNA